VARIRTVKPEFFHNEQLASVAFEWRLLFEGLWLHADRAGRLLDRPVRLKGQLFPYDEVDVNVGLNALVGAGLIRRYVVGDVRLIEIPTLAKHQHFHVKEAASTLPGPDEPGASTVQAPVEPVGREGKGTYKEGKEYCAEPSDDSTPPVLVFPVTGNPNAREWALTQKQIDQWIEAFPSVSVLAECRKAKAWVEADMSHRKTAGGMTRFLFRWLSKTNDTGQRRPTSTLAPSGGPAVPGVEATRAAAQAWKHQ
jgi:hypothetical protein